MPTQPQEAHPAGFFAGGLQDVLHYWSEIMMFLAIVKGAGGLSVGASEAVPPIKISHNGKHFTLAGDKITRDS